MSESNADGLILWPVLLTLSSLTSRSEESLYFLFPFKFSLSLLASMTICHCLNVGSNLLLPLGEIDLTRFDGC